MEQASELEFARGFNHAAILAEFRPELLNDIIPSVNPTNTYFEGFFAGKEQWELDNSNEQLDELENLRNNAENRDMDFERDMQ